jgi:hypothetical protein
MLLRDAAKGIGKKKEISLVKPFDFPGHLPSNLSGHGVSMNISACLWTSFLVFTISISWNTVLIGAGINYQKTADTSEWRWSRDEANPLYCAGQLPPEYGFRIVVDAADRSNLRLAVIGKSGEAVYEWKGHRFSVFRIRNATLFYADWNPHASGGQIVAVDLKTGKELWRSALTAIGLVEHSAYRNLLNLDANNDVVAIYGNESAGRYIEFKDVQNGKTIGHKVFSPTTQPTSRMETKETSQQH